MDIDLTTKTGIQKFIVAIVGIASTVLMSLLGWSPDKTNALVTAITPWIPIIASVLFFIVNQIAAMGKAKTQIKLAEIAAGIAAVSPTVTTTTVTSPPIEVITEPTQTESPIILVKDTINLAKKVISTDSGLWDFLLGAVSRRIDEQIAHLLMVNPNMKTIDAAKEVVEKYLNTKLTEKDCEVINSILGLPAALSAYKDMSIMEDFKKAWDLGRLPRYVLENFRIGANTLIIMQTIGDAAAIVKNDNIPVSDRIRGLLAFGLSEKDANKVQFSGGKVIIWNVNHYEDFNPYILAGYSSNVLGKELAEETF